MNAVAILILAASLSAGPKPGEIQFIPTKITAYKNGLAWVRSEGRGVPDSKGALVTRRLLGALFGSLNIIELGRTKVLSVTTVEREILDKGSKHPARIHEYEGQRVTAHLGVDKVSGTLKGTVPMGPHTALVIESDKDRIMVRLDRVDRLELIGGAGRNQKISRTEKTLRIKLEQPQGRVHLAAEFLTDRLGWLPEYRLDTSDPKKGRFTLSAYLINDLADLSGTEVSLASGVARFQQSTALTPLELPHALHDLLRTLTHGGSSYQSHGMMNNPVMAQQMLGNTLRRRPGSSTPRSSGPATGREVEDTWLYGPLDISLPKGHRGRYPLFEAEVPYENLYYWSVPQGMTDPNNPSPVWLAIKFTNDTKGPLTTGPIIVVEGGQPLGQGLLTYTPAGEEAVVKVSRSTRVFGTAQEIEVDHRRKAGKFGGRYVDHIILKGELTVQNVGRVKAKVRVEKRIMGKVEERSPKAEAHETLLHPGALNPMTTLTWEITLPPGKETTLKYTYQMRQHSN